MLIVLASLTVALAKLGVTPKIRELISLSASASSTLGTPAWLSPLQICTSTPCSVAPSRLMLLVGVLVAVVLLVPPPNNPAMAELEALMVPSPLAAICTAPLGLISWAPLATVMPVWALLAMVEMPLTTDTALRVASSRQ